VETLGNLQERDYRYDNIKALIMLGIVATHVLGTYAPGKLQYFMIMMHSYDMPVFVWISGRFASFKWKKYLKNYLYPYLLFQTLYLLFMTYVVGEPKPLQYHQPYFLLWYMMAMMQWCLTVPLLKRIWGPWRWVFVGATVVLALVVPYSQKISFDWNLGRMFYYYPFFCAGYFSRPYALKPTKKWVTGLFVAGTVLYLIVLYGADLPIYVEWWYGADPYHNGGADYTPLHRILLYGIAVCLGGCILCLMPSKKTFFSRIGQQVTPIYYWHGFLALLLSYTWKPWRVLRNGWVWWLFVEVVSVAILLVFSSKPVAAFTKPFASWPFDGLTEKLRRRQADTAV
jgi:fucose 4-O-acetylase-like acetyltransferase